MTSYVKTTAAFPALRGNTAVGTTPAIAFNPARRRQGRIAETTCRTAAGAHIPERKFLNDQPEGIWRYGKPDYSVVNKTYLDGKQMNWAPGSLQDVVESVVKTFEMEISHKTGAELVQSFAPNFRYRQNGSAGIDGTELLRQGSYNILITDPEYAKHKFDFEESHLQFKSAFPAGFAWEILDVLSGPPTITMKWRHWGKFSGEYAGNKPTEEVIQVFGMAVAKVNDKLQIEDLEIFYDPTDFLASLAKGGAINAENVGKCPFFMPKSLGNMLGFK